MLRADGDQDLVGGRQHAAARQQPGADLVDQQREQYLRGHAAQLFGQALRRLRDLREADLDAVDARDHRVAARRGGLELRRDG